MVVVSLGLATVPKISCWLASQVLIEDCHHCRFLIPACQSSVAARRVENCDFAVACRQLRLTDCKRLRMACYTESPPTLEYCSELLFGCLQVSYFSHPGAFTRISSNLRARSQDRKQLPVRPSVVHSAEKNWFEPHTVSHVFPNPLISLPSLAANFAAARLDPWNNRWFEVFDFTERSHGSAWTVMPYRLEATGLMLRALPGLEKEGEDESEGPVFNTPFSPSSLRSASRSPAGEQPSSQHERRRPGAETGGAGGGGGGEAADEEQDEEEGEEEEELRMEEFGGERERARTPYPRGPPPIPEDVLDEVSAVIGSRGPSSPSSAVSASASLFVPVTVGLPRRPASSNDQNSVFLLLPGGPSAEPRARGLVQRLLPRPSEWSEERDGTGWEPMEDDDERHWDAPVVIRTRRYRPSADETAQLLRVARGGSAGAALAERLRDAGADGLIGMEIAGPGAEREVCEAMEVMGVRLLGRPGQAAGADAGSWAWMGPSGQGTADACRLWFEEWQSERGRPLY